MAHAAAGYANVAIFHPMRRARRIYRRKILCAPVRLKPAPEVDPPAAVSSGAFGEGGLTGPMNALEVAVRNAGRWFLRGEVEDHGIDALPKAEQALFMSGPLREKVMRVSQK